MKKKAIELCLSDLLSTEDNSTLKITRLELKEQLADKEVQTFVSVSTIDVGDGYLNTVYLLRPDREVSVIS